MKLTAFRIKNYRSIVDTNWHPLAYDNVTALIGQNESGKTSILEALKFFYQDNITDDVLRSDLTYPEVYCRFNFDYADFRLRIKPDKLPQEIYSALKELKTIELCRKWNEDKSSKIFVSEPIIFDFYQKQKTEQQEALSFLEKEVKDIINEYTRLDQEFQQYGVEKERLEQVLDIEDDGSKPFMKFFSKARKQVRNLTGGEMDSARLPAENLKEEYREVLNHYQTVRHEMKDLYDRYRAARMVYDANLELEASKAGMEAKLRELKKEEHRVNLNKQYADTGALDKCREEYASALKKFRKSKKDAVLTKHTILKVLNGLSFEEAEKETIVELNQKDKFYKLEDLGKIIFEKVPEFLFFEDFASLLPNKIDLDDIIAENASVEGYKAAKNFLTIAGLEPEFFSEKNNRILKQKIENLNGDISVNFQDFWRQKVGKDNKIKLNFELEHYDFTHPEKSGKPYLEFWIKDNKERLYPKQRSRGVRWFLSFYLELKAAAIANNNNRVLLIDEPGLSLHARAQEDVLMVFEDIRENMQIMYCTHSPHLIDVNKLYRLLAVQRKDHDDYRSDTVIFNAKVLYSASADTLSPIYTLLGVKVSDQHFLHNKNNVIVEDLPSFYYFNTLWEIFEGDKKVYFLPASGPAGIITMANLLTGWKLKFLTLVCDNAAGKESIDFMEQNFLGEGNQYIKINQARLPEDVFSTIDFKRYVLQKREGITELNSEYIKTNKLSRTLLASNFISYSKENNLSKDDFDEETKERVAKIFDQIKEKIQD